MVPVSITDIASQFLATPLPVLYADTCVLLDIIRAPQRYQLLRACVQAATELDTLLSDSRCYLVVGSVVPDEWQSHSEKERANLQRHLDNLEEGVNEFHATCFHLGITLPIGPLGYSRLNLAPNLFDLSERLLKKAIRIKRQSDIDTRAADRVIGKHPPASRGQEFKDCLLLEECFELSRHLIATGYPKKQVFCTTNTEDFCESKGLHPQLRPAFDALQIVFTTALNWAVHEVKN